MFTVITYLLIFASAFILAAIVSAIVKVISALKEYKSRVNETYKSLLEKLEGELQAYSDNSEDLKRYKKGLEDITTRYGIQLKMSVKEIEMDIREKFNLNLK